MERPSRERTLKQCQEACLVPSKSLVPSFILSRPVPRCSGRPFTVPFDVPSIHLKKTRKTQHNRTLRKRIFGCLPTCLPACLLVFRSRSTRVCPSGLRCVTVSICFFLSFIPCCLKLFPFLSTNKLLLTPISLPPYLVNAIEACILPSCLPILHTALQEDDQLAGADDRENVGRSFPSLHRIRTLERSVESPALSKTERNETGEGQKTYRP